MFLKILENKVLLRWLFGPKLRDLRIVLEDHLSKFLYKRDHNLFETQDLNIRELNNCLFYIKDHFAQELGSAPLPLTFLIFENEIPLSTLHFLPGKIYFTRELKDYIEKSLSQTQLFYKIEPIEENLFELLLPPTVPPKLKFPFKEIFYVPLERSCFFCGTYCHESKECPGLSVENPLDKFKGYLELSFENLTIKLKEAYQIAPYKDEFFQGFWGRHFYLFPSFLKYLFYYPQEISFWSAIYEPFAFPIKGGELFLALENLTRGNLSSAEVTFKNFEGEFLGELGLIMVNILKEDYTKALYHIENALSQAVTPFSKSYLIFLKAYLYHYKQDLLLAEDLYNEALKIDSSCLPAFYFLQLLRYENHEPWQKIFPFFQNPYIVYLAFLEPKFIKHQRELEENLEKIFYSYKEEALKRLKELEDKYHHLSEILTEDDQIAYDERIKRIRNSLYSGGLHLIESASKASLELLLELNSYVFATTKRLKSQWRKLQDRYLVLNNFWQKYPYKEEEVHFAKKLLHISNLLEKTGNKLKRAEISKELKWIKKELSQTLTLIEDLEKNREELIKKWRFRTKLRKFLIRFGLSEGAILLLYFLSIFWERGEFTKRIFTLGNFFLVSFFLFILVLFTISIEKDETTISIP